jgi:hypothetical protein
MNTILLPSANKPPLNATDDVIFGLLADRKGNKKLRVCYYSFFKFRIKIKES